MKQDYYKVLGLQSRASAADIRHAHRRLVRRLTKRAEAGDGRARAQLTQLNDAYETLSDKTRRRQYDMALADNKAGSQRFNSGAVAGILTRGAVPMPVGTTPEEVEQQGATVAAPDISSEALDWSGWHRSRFSLRVGEMPLPMAIILAFGLDLVYVLFLTAAFGGDDFDPIVFMPVFLLSTAGLPIAAVLKGRHWFFWGVIGFAAGVTLIVVIFGRPMSHVPFLAMLLARPGKPRCPHCRKRVERGVARCRYCHVDLRAQPA